MKETEEDTNKWKNILCSWVEKINNVEISMLLKAIYRFNVITIKIPVEFSTELEQVILKFAWSYKRLWIAKALFEKEESVELWHKIKALNDTISYPDAKTADYIDTGIEYAIGTFTVVLHIWELYVAYKKRDVEAMRAAINAYYSAREAYKAVEKRPQSATVYTEEYLWHPGVGSTIEKIKEEFAI